LAHDTLCPKPPSVFVRDATGLVRSFTLLDAFVISTAGLLPGLWGFGGAMGFIGGSAPGADMVGSMTVALVLSIPLALVYAYLSGSMPRSGGDYVWISRLVNAPLGFVVTWAVWIAIVSVIGVDCWLFPTVILPVSLGTLGYGLGSASLVSLASTVSTQTPWIFALALILLFLSYLILAFGQEVYSRIMLILFVLVMFSYVVALVVLTGFTHADFVNAVNGYGGTNISYNGIISAAQAQGSSFVPLSFALTLVGVPAAIMVFSGFNYSAIAAGEIRNTQKSMVPAIGGALVFGWLTNCIGIYLTMNVVGYQFYQAALAVGSSWPLVTPPWAPVFIAMLIPHSILILAIIQVGWLLSFFWNNAAYLMLTTRYIFAFSFDRRFPTKLADVNDKGLPVKAMIVNFLIVMAFVTIATFTPWLGLLLNTAAILCIVWVFASIAAIILPYKRKELSQGLPGSKWKVPFVSIVGAISLVFMLLAAYFAFTVPAIGPSTPQAFTVLAAIFISGLVVFIGGTAIQKGRGIDLSRIYKEIPPE